MVSLWREQDTFSSERLPDVVLTPSMSSLTEKGIQGKVTLEIWAKIFAPGNLEIHPDYRNL